MGRAGKDRTHTSFPNLRTAHRAWGPDTATSLVTPPAPAGPRRGEGRLETRPSRRAAGRQGRRLPDAAVPPRKSIGTSTDCTVPTAGPMLCAVRRRPRPRPFRNAPPRRNREERGVSPRKRSRREVSPSRITHPRRRPLRQRTDRSPRSPETHVPVGHGRSLLTGSTPGTCPAARTQVPKIFWVRAATTPHRTAGAVTREPPGSSCRRPRGRRAVPRRSRSPTPARPGEAAVRRRHGRGGGRPYGPCHRLRLGGHLRLSCRALLTEAAGDGEGAANQFGAARFAWHEAGRPHEDARALEARGRCVLPRHLGKGEAHLSEAVGLYRRTGARWDVAHRHRRLRGQGITLARRPVFGQGAAEDTT